MNGDPLLSLKQVAGELNVCVKTIYRLVDSGKLPRPVKVGRCSRFSRSVIDRFKRQIGAFASPSGL
ncbi:helix-turn-helix transcriptional regulator [Terrimicrobium sacchariphilum]|uniref:helix-turn-helix transcriptional regulator n=1 Tax=Terrimicrobium sacchariphilum TaxID=690879 RepID=UPI0009466CC1